MIRGFWSLNILDRTIFSGHRVKRITGSVPAVPNFGSINSLEKSWPNPSDQAVAVVLPKIPYKGNDYVFAFWSFNIYSISDPLNVTSFIKSTTGPNLITLSGDHMLIAKAWYVWDFRGEGEGDNGIYIDAFDIEANDFIANDFVEVAPDPTGKLKKDANNGLINTSQDVNEKEIITATDIPGNYIFANWQTVDSLTFAGDKNNSPSVNGRNILFRHKDTAVSIATYNEPPRPSIRPIYTVAPILAWTLTDSGMFPAPIGTPPEPQGGPFSQLDAAFRLFQDARLVSGQARNDLLNIAQEMVSAAASKIKKAGNDKG